MTTPMVRLSLSIPENLVNATDEIAAARKLSRSKLVSKCLKEMIGKEKRRLLIEGYQAMAKEHSKFAELSSQAAKEVLPSW
jgi:metal-responsive CopG/Arc/MetJ family transcriptional regulator